MKKGRHKADLFKKDGAQERTRSHERDPGCACKRSLSSPRAKRAGALLPGLKMKKAGMKPTFLKQ
ncbi:hypothetical protein, partial [Burkholderia multivorans]|uniref:hypothetical protein n=1 Tax=Burkholderia multivorans TaxID=87883 RepID=UPI001C616078